MINDEILGFSIGLIISSALLYFEYVKYKRDDPENPNPFRSTLGYTKRIIAYVAIFVICFLKLLSLFF